MDYRAFEQRVTAGEAKRSLGFPGDIYRTGDGSVRFTTTYPAGTWGENMGMESRGSAYDAVLSQELRRSPRGIADNVPGDRCMSSIEVVDIRYVGWDPTLQMRVRSPMLAAAVGEWGRLGSDGTSSRQELRACRAPS